jgi:hypothetical protein
VLEKACYAVETFWSGMPAAHQQNILGILALNFKTCKKKKSDNIK